MALPASKNQIIEGEAVTRNVGMPIPQGGPPAPSTASAYGGGGSPGYRFPLMFGIIVLLAFFGGFGIWSATAPLDSAAIAPGQVVVSSNRREVQHLEGGIVSQLMVREGDTVREGDPIIVLDSTQADASLGVLQSRLAYAAARVSRLQAERAGRRRITFPEWLRNARSDPKVNNLLSAEETALRAALDVVREQTGIWQTRARQLEEEINGLREEIRSNEDQLKIIDQEIADQRFLVSRGLGIRRVLLGLERQATEIRGRRARAVAGIARNRQAISESRLRIAELQQTRLTEIDNEMGQLSSEIAGIRQRISAANDVQKRTVIRAPASGKVVNLQTYTVGGIVRPGTPLMEIVPDGDDLKVLARVSPADIDIVWAGLEAQVRLSAYPGRSAPVFDGLVETVSADLLTDERSGVTYYEARVGFKPGDPALAKLSLYPGSPAEVSIVTGEQTLLNSLLRPLTDTVRRGATQN
jgi:HlyD family type I secretion membrane fusion protein